MRASYSTLVPSVSKKSSVDETELGKYVVSDCQTSYMDLTNKGIKRQTYEVRNLIMKAVIKVGTKNILKQKSRNLYHATQHSPVAKFIATNKTILMHKQHILWLFNLFFLQLAESYISKWRMKTVSHYRSIQGMFVTLSS